VELTHGQDFLKDLAGDKQKDVKKAGSCQIFSKGEV